jgi:uncharacterized membrane protein HdeD (DUF308 family)
MAYALTAEEIAVGDVVTAKLEKIWAWYLVGGILSVLFGFFVVSYRDDSPYAVAYFASGYFIGAGLFQLIGSVTVAKHRALFLVMGVLWIGAGIVGFVWPHITIFIIAVLIGWSFLVFGIADILQGLRNHHMPHWWIHLVRGLASMVIAFLALRHPGGALTTLVVLLGIFSILFGVIEIVTSFTARHATRHWEALKSQLG